MRLPDAEHHLRPWRIHELTDGFRLEDVWALPTPGGPDDFPRLVSLIAAGGLSNSHSRAVRTLWAIRVKVGDLLGWDRDHDANRDHSGNHHRDNSKRRAALRIRLPEDLRAGPTGPRHRYAGFTSLYLTGDEWASEIVNRTVHGVMHVSWVGDGAGGYRGQMAVLVRPNGLLGTAYMAFIMPLRRLIVYPAMTRDIARAWQRRPYSPASIRS